MELTGKHCSRCKKFKSLGEFYQQGNRHESFCKDCKRKARANRAEKPEEAKLLEFHSEQHASKEQTARRLEIDLSERETMPVYDESIFDPEERVRRLGYTSDDIADAVAFFRWIIEQREKQNKKGESL